MARGKATGKNLLPRIGKPEGVDARLEARQATMPKAKHQGEYHKPGSRNRKKASR